MPPFVAQGGQVELQRESSVENRNGLIAEMFSRGRVPSNDSVFHTSTAFVTSFSTR
jgi:hypothetical protein